jgi:hypothetical protein
MYMCESVVDSIIVAMEWIGSPFIYRYRFVTSTFLGSYGTTTMFLSF